MLKQDQAITKGNFFGGDREKTSMVQGQEEDKKNYNKNNIKKFNKQ